ncbi:hypothetical protein HYV21_00215 [Candidatus Microgenomates bacterium]|nr:hypothetical protein [Candidatus Microgenomates bacterium]
MIYLPFLPREKIKHPALLLTALIRIGASYFFFIDLWVGWIIWTVLDTLDSIPLRNFAKLTAIEYEIFDKYIDNVVYIVMLLASIKYGVFWPLLVLVFARIIGEILFFRTKDEKYLIYFPNLFEPYWLWTVAATSPLIPTFLDIFKTTNGLIYLVLLKLLQEAIKHYFGPKYIFPIVDRFMGRDYNL